MATQEIFEVDEHHLKLLERLQFEWDSDGYDGAPRVDLKRPYGNSDVLADVRELYAAAYGCEYLQNENYEVSFVYPDGLVVDAEDLDEQIWQHHKDMPTVLEILSSIHGEGFQPGIYRRVKPYSQIWERYGESGATSAEPKLSRFTAEPYYTIEPHAKWVKPGQININEIAEKVYGKPFNSLSASLTDNENLPNDSVVVYRFPESDDFDNYGEILGQFDEKSVYLGYDRATKTSVSKEGMTEIEYWLSISWSDDPTKVTVDANPPEGTDLEGAVFPGEFYAQRAFSPSLGGVIADLIRRGELPRGNYIFRHWW